MKNSNGFQVDMKATLVIWPTVIVNVIKYQFLVLLFNFHRKICFNTTLFCLRLSDTSTLNIKCHDYQQLTDKTLKEHTQLSAGTFSILCILFLYWSTDAETVVFQGTILNALIDRIAKQNTASSIVHHKYYCMNTRFEWTSIITVGYICRSRTADIISS
jgi:hypothetical protein